MDKVPPVKVKQFEREFIELMRASHAVVLNNLRAGKLEDTDVDTIKTVAQDLSSKYAG
jgi:F-type H+-transporting ATPase subunit alpha